MSRNQTRPNKKLGGMAHTLDTNFEWKPDYNTVLQEIGNTDLVNTDWPVLRNIIKYKIQQNVSMFLSGSEQPRPVPRAFSPQLLPSGGLKLPPFPHRKRNEPKAIEANVLEPNIMEAPISFMNEQQATEMTRVIFAQLHEFDDGPPFTIQRVCELCLRPKEHYNSVGKYLRAVEKSLLVTSTINAFPPLTEKEKDLFVGTTVTLGSTPQSAPSTPLFSPIPFLHEDVRRSKSRSPPPSPLVLNATIPGSEQKALGLVDELDDPSPGHMSDRPTPLSSTTRPLFGNLEERFVRSSGRDEGSPAQQRSGDDVVLDDADDKENKG